MTTGLATDEVADADRYGAGRPRRRRRPVVAGAIAAVLVVTVGVLVVVDPFGGGSPAGNRTRTSLVTVKQQDLASQTQVNGTLGYGGSYTVLSLAQGTITALPVVGQTITQGQMVFEADGKPVVLFYGAKPAYRSIAVGDKGPDVAQLNANLVALGYATSDELDPSSDTFSAATATALKKLQADLGLDKTGTLERGQAVFLPSAIRVTAVSASVGGPAGGPILTASSTTRIVTVNLSANLQSQVKVGDNVTITLPDHKTTPGVVFSVGSVATAASAGASPTVPVVIIPSNPDATGSLDQAPVQVSIITATAKNVFVVPVNALLALAGGGYALETVSARGVHRLVPVELGLFDDAAGLVQVSGKDVHAGQRVVVPAS
jgi:hypothetical protein